MFQKERRIRCHLVFHIQRHRFLDSEHQTKNREKLSLSCMPQIFYFDVLQKPGKLFPRSEVRHSLALPCRNGAGSEKQRPASEGFRIRMYCISDFWIFQKSNPWFSKGHDAISFQHCLIALPSDTVSVLEYKAILKLFHQWIFI